MWRADCPRWGPMREPQALHSPRKEGHVMSTLDWCLLTLLGLVVSICASVLFGHVLAMSSEPEPGPAMREALEEEMRQMRKEKE